MTTATFVRELTDFRGSAGLYKLSEPVSYGWDENEKPTTEYIVVSATVAPYSGPETYIFPADEAGEIVDWGEMEGSIRGTLSHEDAIHEAGWVISR